MKKRCLAICLAICLAMSVTLAGCSLQPKDVQAFDAAPLPSLELPLHNVEKSGPLVVAPTKVALGHEIVIRIEDLKPDQLAGLGLALLGPDGTKLSTIAPVQPHQKMVIPMDGQPGAYKVWLAGASFAASSGINLVVVDVYDAVPPALRNSDPLKIVETYFSALSQKDYLLARQALSSEQSSGAAWLRTAEATMESVRVNKVIPQSTLLKATDQSYRCTVELEIKTRAWGVTLGRVVRTTRHLTLHKESGGWRIERISMLP